MESGQQKTALEVAFAGGLFTQDRAMRRAAQAKRMCTCSLHEFDNDIHRYWRCPKWARTRPIMEDWPPVDHLTLHTGLIPLCSSLRQDQILLIQRHLIEVVLANSIEHRARQGIEPHGTDDAQGDENDGHDGPPCAWDDHKHDEDESGRARTHGL